MMHRWCLKHDPENASPGLDPGWKPVFRADHAPAHSTIRQSGNRLFFGTDHAPADSKILKQ
jgi:hypothetical protein